MRIVILYNSVKADANLDDLDTIVQVNAIAGALKSFGDDVVTVSCDLNLAAIKAALLSIAPSLVVNLVESLDESGRLIHLVPALVERLGLPMTGCSSEAILTTSNKLLAKETMRAAGLKVPNWFVYPTRSCDISIPSEGRMIVKSVWEHASVGIDQSSLVIPSSAEVLTSEILNRRALFGGDWFAERFIDGREFNLSVVETAEGPCVLPPAEIRFIDFPKDMPKIIDFRAKWETDSFEYAHTVRCFDFPPEDAELIETMKNLALRAFKVFGLRGYARADFRVDDYGEPFILEINANPCLSPDAGFAAAAERAGISYSELIRCITQEALLRFSKPPCGSIETVLVNNHKYNGNTDKMVETNNSKSLRETVFADDRLHIEEMVRATGFFSEGEVEIALELFDAFFTQGTKSGYHFLISEEKGKPTGFSTFGPIPGTQSSFDLYWVVVHPSYQRKGIGALLLQETEKYICKLGGTRVYAETSGRPQYNPTRTFYESNGYGLEARMKDYYSFADDLMIYLKILSFPVAAAKDN